MLPCGIRIDLGRLHAYRIAESQALRKYRLYKSAVDNVNKVIDIICREPECSKLSEKLTRLNNEYLVAQRGVVDKDGVLRHEDTRAGSESLAQRMLAKRLGRPLLHCNHPDKGGDAGKFSMILDAVRRGDVVLLQLLGRTGHNLTWKCTEGEGHMKQIASVYESRMSKVRSSPLTEAVRLYQQGKKSQAVNSLAAFLQSRIAERQRELLQITTRKSV